MLFAIMPLVIGGPDVAFCQLSLYWTSMYLPVFGRFFSRRPSSLITTPPVTVLVVVFCVPIPISNTSARKCTGERRSAPAMHQTAALEDATTTLILLPL